MFARYAGQLIIDSVNIFISRVYKEHKMKRTIVIATTILLAIALGSCNLLGSIVNPVIGTWQTTILGVSVSSTFNADATFTDTNSLGSVGVTNNGTWTSTSLQIVKTWADDSTETLSYSFNSDKSEMTLVPDPVGAAIIYTRQ